MPGAPSLWCGGGDLSSIFLLFHWGIKLIWSFPLEGHKDLCDKVGSDGQGLDTAVESRSSSLPTPLEQHPPSLPILRESQGPWNQVRCNTLSSSGFLCSEHPRCRKGKQATPQMQESVTLETENYCVTLLSTQSLWPLSSNQGFGTRCGQWPESLWPARPALRTARSCEICSQQLWNEVVSSSSKAPSHLWECTGFRVSKTLWTQDLFLGMGLYNLLFVF